jgi:hypothetical protein
MAQARAEQVKWQADVLPLAGCVKRLGQIEVA